jgi:hypothetical protein
MEIVQNNEQHADMGAHQLGEQCVMLAVCQCLHMRMSCAF